MEDNLMFVNQLQVDAEDTDGHWCALGALADADLCIFFKRMFTGQACERAGAGAGRPSGPEKPQFYRGKLNDFTLKRQCTFLSLTSSGQD